MGGMVAAIEKGYPHREIENSSYSYGRSIESGDRVIVGVNKFTEAESTDFKLFSVSEETERRQLESLAAVKAGRDQAKVADSLAALEKAARGTGNLMPVILDAVRLNVSIGEICGVLQNVFGEYTEGYI